MITIKQLYEGLVSGKITIDENGHDPFYGWGPTRMIEGLGRKIDFFDNESSLAKKGIVWSESLLSEMSVDNDRHISVIERDSPCSRCGKSLGWIYNHTESKITCVVAELNTQRKPTREWFYEYDESRCELEYNTPKSFEFEVKEEIVFANFFKDHMDKLDEVEKERPYDYFSLNTEAGRRRIFEFHANDNIGYQQLGNTLIDIYLSQDQTEFLVIEDTCVYAEDPETEEEFEAREELPKLGWNYCGSVSCDMWRYMFGNVSDVKDPRGSITKLTPKPGKYLATNYYGSSEHESHKIDRFPIASRVKLIK